MLNSEDYLNIFHEIKNSITLISSSLQLVEKKHPEVSDFAYWAETMSEITSLRNLRHVNLYDYMEEIHDSISAFSALDFHCNIITEKNLPEIDIDPQLLKQALINLLKNAYEAMNKSGTVTIRVSSANNSVLIAVTDYGGGLDPSFADSIFEPFITSKNGGSGLGLVITKQTIDCDSRPGDGCTFTLTLPLTQN